MHAYYLLKNPVLLQQFDQTMFEEVIVPFHFEYFIEKYAGINPSTFKMEITRYLSHKEKECGGKQTMF
jgi:hypothetical protein